MSGIGTSRSQERDRDSCVLGGVAPRRRGAGEWGGARGKAKQGLGEHRLSPDPTGSTGA